ncbi:hypothetical protein ACC693_37860, partial [Rhizobium ruizarguesonis]
AGEFELKPGSNAGFFRSAFVQLQIFTAVTIDKGTGVRFPGLGFLLMNRLAKTLLPTAPPTHASLLP